MTIETANRLYELRKQNNLSQEELAEKLGVSRQAVSKWERSEASPDTDNLIALAKIYNLTLDELIFGEKQSEEKESVKEAEQETEEKTESDEKAKKGTSKVDIGPMGIFVESEDGDKVQINLKGIKVTEGKRKNEDSDGGVEINLGGLKIEKDASFLFDDDEDDDENEDDEDENETISKESDASYWKKLPYPIVCVAAYLLFSSLNMLGGWGKLWVIFVTIPIYYSIINAICKKRLAKLDYSSLSAFIFLYLGMYHRCWHPSWVIFITVPIFYSIAKVIDKKTKLKQTTKTDK